MASNREPLPQKQTPYIMVVDDEKVIAETLALILHSNGYSAAFFASPLDALHSAGTNAPDLLISDVWMPELSGVDLAIQIKAQCPSCRILLFSGQANTADLLASAREQGHDFNLLAKPINPSELLRKIREHDPS